MKERKNVCPKCGYGLLAREGLHKIYCLRNGCDWFIDLKREEDMEIPEIHSLADEWHGI